jgi:hypothetical protein
MGSYDAKLMQLPKIMINTINSKSECVQICALKFAANHSQLAACCDRLWHALLLHSRHVSMGQRQGGGWSKFKSSFLSCLSNTAAACTQSTSAVGDHLYACPGSHASWQYHGFMLLHTTHLPNSELSKICYICSSRLP